MTKPEYLKFPFIQGQRKVLLQDRILYVPHDCQPDAFQFSGWESPEIFSNNLPIKIEYCSGNGAWIASKAQEDLSCNWVAIEKKFMRVKKIWSKMKNLQLNQLLIVCGEGYQATQNYFPSASVTEIFINFPDPWPKTRHFKHRLIQPPFISEMLRILKQGGQLTFVTDDPAYSEWMMKKIKESPGFVSKTAEPYLIEMPGYGSSYFEDLWREKGKEIRYHQYYKA